MKRRTIKPMTAVRFTPCKYIKEWIAEHPKQGKIAYPFNTGKNDHYLCLGEIRGMPGHVAVVDDKGLIRWGYHTEGFTPVPNEEL